MNEGHSKQVAILRAVQAIPAGHVQTYGQVAEAAGLPRRARLVGAVLLMVAIGLALSEFGIL